MHATEIVGWTFNGAAYCDDHRPEGDEEEIRPVFASDEGWTTMTCDHPHNAEGEALLFETLGEIAGLDPECSECGETLDTGCDGRRRCPSCDEPCAGCGAGAEPEEDGPPF